MHACKRQRWAIACTASVKKFWQCARVYFQVARAGSAEGGCSACMPAAVKPRRYLLRWHVAGKGAGSALKRSPRTVALASAGKRDPAASGGLLPDVPCTVGSDASLTTCCAGFGRRAGHNGERRAAARRGVQRLPARWLAHPRRRPLHRRCAEAARAARVGLLGRAALQHLPADQGGSNTRRPADADRPMSGKVGSCLWSGLQGR